MRSPEERLAWALDTCARAQMRLTPLRRAILRFLAWEQTPATLAAVTQAHGVLGRCSGTTVYRTLMLFKEAEVLRLVGTTHKASYFVLNPPGENRLFLVCGHCGTIVPLPLPGSLEGTMAGVAAARGFLTSPLNCEVQSVCARCQAARQKWIAPSKLSLGAQRRGP